MLTNRLAVVLIDPFGLPVGRNDQQRYSLLLMLAMGLAMSLIMYSNASTAVGFMLGTRSGAAFDKFCEVSPLIEMRGKGMTFLRKHEVFAHMGKTMSKEKNFCKRRALLVELL